MHDHDPRWCNRLREASARPVRPYPESPPGYVCDICGSLMYEHNCKIVCPTCGYKRDCSDP